MLPQRHDKMESLPTEKMAWHAASGFTKLGLSRENRAADALDAPGDADRVPAASLANVTSPIERAERSGRIKGLKLTRCSGHVLKQRRALLRHLCDATLLVDTVGTIFGWASTNVDGIFCKGGWVVHRWSGTRWYRAIGILFIAPLYFLLAVGGGHFSLPLCLSLTLASFAPTDTLRSINLDCRPLSLPANELRRFVLLSHVYSILPPATTGYQPPSPAENATTVNAWVLDPATSRDRVKVARSTIDPANQGVETAGRRAYAPTRFTFHSAFPPAKSSAAPVLKLCSLDNSRGSRWMIF